MSPVLTIDRSRLAGTPAAMLVAPDHVPVPFAERRLRNGLRVIVHEDHSAPIVAVHAMYHVGSKQDPPGLTGLAHMVEHLLYRGSRHVPEGDYATHIQNAGGVFNGSTSFDRTNFFCVVPVNALELALWLESDRMGFALSALTERTFSAQRSVIQNERRQQIENQPYGQWLEQVLTLLFPAGHPYAHSPIGSVTDLRHTLLDDARDFLRTHYGPNTCTLVLAGDVTPALAWQLAERYFGGIPPVPPQAAARPTRVAVTEERRLTLVEPVAVPRIYIAYHAPRWPAPETPPLVLATHVLAGGRHSRLYRELIYRRRIAQEASAIKWQELELTGLVLVVLTGKPDTDPAELLAAYDAEVDQLVAGGITADELIHARSQAQLACIDRLQDVAGRADALAHAAVLLDDPGYVAREQAILRDVTAEAVREAVERHLPRAGRVIVTIAPGAAHHG
ncbi:MAG: M16 family metallopeptidase [Gemmatimonadota bacterium]